ncbi:DUF5820 family protein [Haladaptatus sp. YSMS36]|uniref:DUF5820 family protein n=1 Tax=Haladaptatus sp. YSMS36 TaxID=3033384 RepID=UPI0023E85368|nr:DUF5820 family protein [Haladaptatus sp. YSMS36]
MSSFDSLHDAWEVWSDEEDGRTVLAFRPDVFNTQDFPPVCLPTLYLTQGRRNRRPGIEHQLRPDDPWFITLYLEPDVSRKAEPFDTRAAAVDAALSLTTRFATGDYDYRSLYQVPRENYLDKLDELTGREA